MFTDYDLYAFSAYGHIKVIAESLLCPLQMAKKSLHSVGGIQARNRHIFISKASGLIQFINPVDKSSQMSINAGQIETSKLLVNRVATGGRNNNLKVWDLANPSIPLFSAKNVRPSTLQLEAPIWISDLSFCPGSNGNLIITSSRYAEINLFDLRSGQRRPSSRVAWRQSRKHGKAIVGRGTHPAMLPDLSTTRPITRVLPLEHASGATMRVVSGNAIGELCLLDFRVPNQVILCEDATTRRKSLGAKSPQFPTSVTTLLGASGSITGIVSGGGEANLPHMASGTTTINDCPIIIVSSIDRYLRVYHRDSGERIAKIYTGIPISGFVVRRGANVPALLRNNDDAEYAHATEPAEPPSWPSLGAQKDISLGQKDLIWDRMECSDELVAFANDLIAVAHKLPRHMQHLYQASARALTDWCRG
ncbi:unnamed protein product [Protopolystoma xenopodis]|uniref:Uncharacterized protein n=1 Tax=Protopolystoma xenopodis TaxID=117903 RepID=A0A448WSI8_9PLAT|nr:unnamed protein product [Protopolystoma xenopodis]